MFSASFVAFVLSAMSLGASASAPATNVVTSLNFATSLKSAGGLKALVESDRARALALMGVETHGVQQLLSKPVNVQNQFVTYTSTVGVGSPPTYYSLLIDTGSSNTWIGAGKAYKPTSTSHNTGKKVSVSYGSGQFNGTEYLDTVKLSNSLIITGQSIGVASSSVGFEGVDGILGVGPLDLTQGTLINAKNTTTIPTVTNSLFKSKQISSEVLGIYYVPAAEPAGSNGTLTFGGANKALYTGDITYVPVTETFPANFYWGLNETISYGGQEIMSNAAGISDTGTTLIMLPSNSFAVYQNLTGATMDNSTGLLTVTPAQYSNLQNLEFGIGGTTFTLTPNAQIFPRSLNAQIGGNNDTIYLIVSTTGVLSGIGLDFINGYAFLERFYSVYDTTNKRIGYATTQFTNSTSN